MSKAITPEYFITSSDISGGVETTAVKIGLLRMKSERLSMAPTKKDVVKKRDASKLALLYALPPIYWETMLKLAVVKAIETA
jgi:hypothetical protein